MSGTVAAALVDDLWRIAIEEPDSIDDATLSEWLAEATAALDQPVAKEPAAVMRKAVRLARKLARYWQERDASSLPDWRNGVDEALGAFGWEPQLDLVRWALDASPDPMTFDEVKTRFRAVHFTPWMEGVSYEEWLAGR